jgi:hypothetical protein
MRAWAAAGLALCAAAVLVGPRAAVADTPCPTKNRPNDLKLVAGSPQTAKVGTAFDTPLQVQLANRNGCPLTGSLSGVEVEFTAPSDGASGTFSSSGSTSITVGTDSSGRATAPAFTANGSEGDYEIRAESRYGSVTFHLSNSAAGVAASAAASGQTEQAATVNSQYAAPLQVKVQDAHGAPVQGVDVTFAIGTGPSGAGASFLGGGPQATAKADASGQATSPPLVANGTPGPFTATASVSGISGVIAFNLANHAAVYTLTAAGATTQTAAINRRYAAPLQVQVLDDAGRPVEGTSVAFALAAGPTGAGATFVGGAGAQATALTDAAGKASSPPLVANGTPGRFTATATVAGSTALTYPLRNVAGRLTATRRTLTAVVKIRFQQRLRARLVDGAGHPLDGVSVAFTITKGDSGAGATFLDGSGLATVTTDTSGWATSPALIANTIAGSFTATATTTGSKPLAYTLTNRAGKPLTITVGAAAGESTHVGSRFPIRLAVTVVDDDDNPVVRAVVTFAAPGGGPSATFAVRRRGHRRPAHMRIVHVKTDSKGIAIAPPLTANAHAGGYVVKAVVAGTQLHAAFGLINKA